MISAMTTQWPSWLQGTAWATQKPLGQLLLNSRYIIPPIKQEDIRFNAAIQAWYNQTVQATKGKGKSVRSAYRTFNEFYDHEKEFSKIFKPEDTAPRSRALSLADKNRIINQQKKGGS